MRSFLAKLASLLNRFGKWWLQTFKNRGLLGKFLFGSISLLFACLICSVPASWILPDPTPTEVASSQSTTNTVEPTEPANTPASTDTPAPTNTPEPTATFTATPTKTMTPSSTPTNTPTSTSTSTATPDAPFVEALVLAIIRKGDGQDFQQIAAGLEGDTMWVLSVSEDGNWYEVLNEESKTGWVAAEDVSVLDLAIVDGLAVSTSVPTLTPTPTNTPPPPTLTAKQQQDAMREILDETFEEVVDARELEIRGDDYIGKAIRLRGQIFNIMQDGVQIWVQSPGGRIAVAVGTDPSDLPEGIYENSYITVYGIGGGTIEGTNAFGGTVSQPVIFASEIMP